MSVYKDVMNSIEPKASPEELARKITDKARKRQGAKPFAAIAAGAAATVALTVTAGAAGGLNFGDFFKGLFGESAENMEGYLLDPDSLEGVTNTFEDYDFKVVGLAMDDHLLYAAVEVTAKNGAKMSELAKELSFGLECGSRDFTGTSSNSVWESISEEKGTLLVRCYSDASFDGGVSVALSADSMNGCFEIRFGTERTESIKVEVGREIMMPVKEWREQRWQPRDKPRYLKSVDVSGISLILECSYPVYEENVIADAEKIFAELDDGTVIGMEHASTRGETADGVYLTHVCFSLEHPVEVSRIAKVKIGEETVNVG